MWKGEDFRGWLAAFGSLPLPGWGLPAARFGRAGCKGKKQAAGVLCRCLNLHVLVCRGSMRAAEVVNA